jgi:hypothetical protein
MPERSVRRAVALLAALVPLLGAAVVAAPASLASSVRTPPAGARFDYQLGGPAQYSPAPAIVVRDSTDKPWPGRYNVCYVNAFQTQPGDPALRASELKVAGQTVEDPDWPGEFVLDTRGHRAQLVAAFAPVLASCARRGYRGVELDNLDSYSRSKGGLIPADNLGYARALIAIAHRLGLAVAQKNAVELVGKAPFDFAITESCLLYQECGPFAARYRVVLDVEYSDQTSPATFHARCRAASKASKALSFEYRDVELTPRGVRAWCS